jgi:hypothetical protein
MARPKGIRNHTETKNRVLRLRLTAREYAQTKQIANATNHNPSEMIRKFINDGLKTPMSKSVLVNCRTSNYLSKPLKSNNNNNNNKLSLSLKDKLSYKESISSDIPSWIDVDSEKYIAKLEEYVARPDADVLIRELYKLELKDLKEKSV